VLSLPAFVLFWSGGGLKDSEETQSPFNLLVTSLSLANLGQKTTSMHQLDLMRKSDKIEVICDVGKIQGII